MLRDPEVRRYVADNCLALATPFHPATGFSVANAMARNKLIYCIADLAVVVSSSLDRGGTRAGALENLRAGWVPLFVRTGARAPEGNQALIAEGGIRLSPESLPEDSTFRHWFDEQVRSMSTMEPDGSGAARQAPPEPLLPTDAGSAHAPVEPEQRPISPHNYDLFPVIWPHLCHYLQEWRTAKDVAAFHDLEIAQARAWLARAVQEGLAERQKRRAVFRVLDAERVVVQHAMPLPEAGQESNLH
jgi:predicted Rossmann fold nucleotide-binding protein DprA/Smf involved in DNA uptake